MVRTDLLLVAQYLAKYSDPFSVRLYSVFKCTTTIHPGIFRNLKIACNMRCSKVALMEYVLTIFFRSINILFLVAARVTAELVVGNVDKLGDNQILEGWLGWQLSGCLLVGTESRRPVSG